MRWFGAGCLLSCFGTSMVLLAALSAAAAAAAAAEKANGGSPLTGALGNATVVVDNPPNVTYVAVLPSNFSSKIRGSIYATANPDGIGVQFKVNLTNFPPELGPFAYHIHVSPIPSDGNCTGALGHLDPFIRGEDVACQKALPQTCQVGDLSGKHGKITEDPFSAQYLEDFASTSQGIGAFLGNRSFVVHSANKTRLTCANFSLYQPPLPSAASGNKSHGPEQFQGGASHLYTFPWAAFSLVAAFALLF